MINFKQIIEGLIKGRDYQNTFYNVVVKNVVLNKNDNYNFDCEIDYKGNLDIKTNMNYVFINSHYLSEGKLHLNITTGFASPMNTWEAEVSYLLYFYYTPGY